MLYIYLFLCLIYICEIADIYDVQNKYLFHNKKNSDLRVWSCQIFIGALQLKNKDKTKKCIDFINTNNIDINDFKYVFGLLQERNKIGIHNQIAIGNACFILKKLNIEYLVDLIDYDNI
jgi:hypothetical protein